MRFILDIDKDKVVSYLESTFRDLVRFLYQWMSSDGEVLGYILGIWHAMVCITIFICILISHTVYPAFWFQVGVFLSLFTIWIQHIFLQVCVVFVAEVSLTNKEPPFYTILRNLTGINPEEYSTNFLLAETVGVGCLFLGILCRISVYLHEYYGIKI